MHFSGPLVVRRSIQDGVSGGELSYFYCCGLGIFCDLLLNFDGAVASVQNYWSNRLSAVLINLSRANSTSNGKVIEKCCPLQELSYLKGGGGDQSRATARGSGSIQT